MSIRFSDFRTLNSAPEAIRANALALWRQNFEVGRNVLKVRRVARHDVYRLFPAGKSRVQRIAVIVARLLYGLRNGGGWHATGPDLEFTAFNDASGSAGLHFQNDAPRRLGRPEFLPPGNSSRPPQITRQHDPVGGVKFNDRLHGITLARSWRIYKLQHERYGTGMAKWADGTGVGLQALGERVSVGHGIPQRRWRGFF